MTTIINIWTIDGVLHTFRQTSSPDAEAVLARMKQPGRLFEKTLVISTPLYTSLIAGQMIARIEVISHEFDAESLLADHTIQLVSLDPGAESPHRGREVGTQSSVRVDFRLLGEMMFSAGYERDTPSLARMDILQKLVGIFDAGWFYYKIKESGIGLINTKATASIDIHAGDLAVPVDSWHAVDGTVE